MRPSLLCEGSVGRRVTNSRRRTNMAARSWPCTKNGRETPSERLRMWRSRLWAQTASEQLGSRRNALRDCPVQLFKSVWRKRNIDGFQVLF